MLFDEVFKFNVAETELRQPDSDLVGAEDARGLLDIEQPVVKQCWIGSFAIKQKFCLRLFAQDPVLDGVFIVLQFDLFDIR